MEMFQRTTVQSKIAHPQSNQSHWGIYFSEHSPPSYQEALLNWTGFLMPSPNNSDRHWASWFSLTILEKTQVILQ